MLNNTLSGLCHPLSQCQHLVVHILYVYLVQECHAAVTLLLSEACLFVIRMGDSFDCHVGKRVEVTFLAQTLQRLSAGFIYVCYHLGVVQTKKGTYFELCFDFFLHIYFQGLFSFVLQEVSKAYIHDRTNPDWCQNYTSAKQ